MRTLETVASKSDDGLLFESYGYTDIFIKPQVFEDENGL